MLEILTPMNKIERVSRKITPASFTAEPGIWAPVQSDGSLANVTTDTPELVNKLTITSASSNVYESHDVEVGRITCMESHGVRIKVDSEGWHAGAIGDITVGDLLYVAASTGNEGKLASVSDNPDTLSSGTYEQVARVEEVNSAGWIIYRTISPTTHTFT
jgi:hypothetical protein